jgi:hypothetical protein
MAIEGAGTTISFSTLSGAVERIGSSTIEAAVIPTTSLGSTWATKMLSTVADAGELDIDVQIAVDVAIPAVGTADDLLITFPDALTFGCAALLSKMTMPEATVGAKLMTTLTFTLTGEPTASWL